MTDDNDRTQEIRRDGDRYTPSDQQDSSGQGPSRDRGSGRDRGDDTAVFGRPAPGPGQQAGGYPPSGGYPPAGGGYGYRPTPGQPGPGQAPAGQGGPAPSYAPMLPADRGSGGFPAAIIGAVVATLVAVATSFGGYQILKNTSIDSQDLAGFVTYRMNLVPWPSRGGNDVTTAFVVGVLIVLIITLLLMMAAVMSTRAGTGGFAVFLAAWMASVIAGGVARPVADAIGFGGQQPRGLWQLDISSGVLWGVLFGWVAALVLVIVHAMRRKPAAR